MGQHVLSQDELQHLQDLADDLGAELRTDYSGRGAYGKTCIGFVTPEPYGLCMELGRQEDDLGLGPAGLGIPKVDSMGRESIVYFPRLTVAKETQPETLAEEHARIVHPDGSECPDGCDRPPARSA